MIHAEVAPFQSSRTHDLTHDWLGPALLRTIAGGAVTDQVGDLVQVVDVQQDH